VLAYQSDPRYLRFYPIDSRDEIAVRAFVLKLVDQQTEQPRQKYQFAVLLKESGRLIGNAGIRMRTPGVVTADMGYEIAPDEWGRGYASEAARAVLNFGFRELRLHRVWAECIAGNAASERVLQKLGMRLEGRLRENEFFKGRWWDTLIYAILVQEWIGSQRA
jgi:RimJ/RimL family protein N-acetyltransferase